jgi:hypothetical protein
LVADTFGSALADLTAGVCAAGVGLTIGRGRLGSAGATGATFGVALVGDAESDDAIDVGADLGPLGTTLVADIAVFAAGAFNRLRATIPATTPAATMITALPTKSIGGHVFFRASR